MKIKFYKGQDYSKESKLTVPNQAMSLQEILNRFVRNEPLAIGKDVNYHESDDDLEKLARLDPVDKMAYIQKMQEVQDKFQAQEESRRLKMEEKARQEFLEKLEKEKSANSGATAK
jgi:hypothetical protein